MFADDEGYFQVIHNIITIMYVKNKYNLIE